ncbi:MAG: GxxExxY protein [Planctomycetaceae bacterium]|jgi:GxxExxY protein
MHINELSSVVIGAAIEVHKHLGPGLLENAYQKCLERELALREIPFVAEHPLPVVYKETHVDCGYRLDLWVDHRLVVELKAVESLVPIHQAQLLTYLRLTRCEVGLLINFNVPRLTDGVKRMVNRYQGGMALPGILQRSAQQRTSQAWLRLFL